MSRIGKNPGRERANSSWKLTKEAEEEATAGAKVGREATQVGPFVR